MILSNAQVCMKRARRIYHYAGTSVAQSFEVKTFATSRKSSVWALYSLVLASKKVKQLIQGTVWGTIFLSSLYQLCPPTLFRTLVPVQVKLLVRSFSFSQLFLNNAARNLPAPSPSH